jgi:uncharacterized protein with PIN domain
MDGKLEALRERWERRADEVFRRMFKAKDGKELVTLTQREGVAVSLAKELAAFLLESHVALDRAAEPAEASTTCCPKCGQPGRPAVEEDDKLPERMVTTSAGDIRLHRQRWECAKCRIIFFSARRSARSGDGRLQPDGAVEGGSSVDQGVVVQGCE